MQQLFPKPVDGWVGDVIPWQEDGVFSLFYLHDVREHPKPGTPWRRLVTADLVTFDDVGVALTAGAQDAADFNAYTGSVVRDGDGVHHLFYTGQNPRIHGEDGLPPQLVMHATSLDGMVTWQRHPDHTFGASAGYESGDWRDPFVFRDDAAGVWRMLIAARHSDGPERRRGVIAQCVSTDLVHWQAAEPFWDPRRYIAHECPEVFGWNGWWYLVFSEFSDAFTTRYRMSRSPYGPWTTPRHDSLDGRAYYAAKSAERDGRRLFFGWIATREDDRDDGKWQWAGTLSVLEARQNPGGTLAFGFTDETLDRWGDTVQFDDQRGDGTPFASTLDARGRHIAVTSDTDMPATFRATVRFRLTDDSDECGVVLRSTPDADTAYSIRLEPRRNRMVFDRWPRQRTGDGQWEVSGDVPHIIELERPCDLGVGEHVLDVIVDGDICVANLDRSVVLSTRIYDLTAGRFGVFATEGVMEVEEITISTPVANNLDLVPALATAAR